MHCIHGRECPVAEEDSVTIMGGKLGVGAGDHPDRATRSNVNNRTNGIRKVLSPFLRGGTPTILPTGHTVVYSGWTIPWSTHVPLHVGIVYKHFTISVEGKITGVTVAHIDHFPVGAVWIQTDDPSAGCLSVTIMTICVVFQKDIILPVCGDAGGLKGWVTGVIAGYKVETCAIFGNDEGVRTMFPPATQAK